MVSNESDHLEQLSILPQGGELRILISSIEDQTRDCRQLAAQRGWVIEEARSDQAKTGAILARRDVMKSLIADAQKRPAPFDCFLVSTAAHAWQIEKMTNFPQ